MSFKTMNQETNTPESSSKYLLWYHIKYTNQYGNELEETKLFIQFSCMLKT